MKTLEKMEGLKQRGKSLLLEFFSESMTFIEDVKIKSKDLVKTNYELGMFHLNKQNLSDARMRFKMVSLINPHYMDVFYQLARCYQYSRKFDKALESLAKCALGEKVDYRLNLLKRLAVEEIPIDILEEDFDFVASTYDSASRTEDLHRSHNIITKLKEILARDNRINDSLSILDVGCGNGDCGKILRASLNVSFLEGIDISNEMIKVCESQIFDHELKRRTYDKLIKMDLRALHAEGHDKKFDIIFMCNVLEYSKNIPEIIRSFRKLLNPGGYLAIQLPKSQDKNISFDYENGNFCFGDEYLKTICGENNFKISELALADGVDQEMHVIIMQ